MKTIEIKIEGQPAQFTTKSLTFNGREYFYSNMLSVMNDDENHNYAFAYDGQVIVLPYEAKDAKILNAIFSQVRNLPKKSTPPAAAETVKPTVSGASEPIKVSEIVKTSENSPSQEAEAFEKTPSFAEGQNEPQAPSENAKEDGSESKTEHMEASDDRKLSKEEKKAEKERIKAEKRAEKERKKAEKAELKTSGSEGNEAHNPEKKEKLKKSFIVFGIIIAAFVLISVVYYFVVGTSSNPNVGPNSTESQQYDDIDELIDDLQ